MIDLKSDAPIPGAGPALAIKRFIVNTFKLSGRASRSEYWWATAFAASVIAVPMSLDIKKNWEENKRLRAEAEARGEEAPKPKDPQFSVATWVTAGLLLPSMASLEARRLHDANHSAAWMVFSPINTIFCLLPSDSRGARFDKARDNNQDVLS